MEVHSSEVDEKSKPVQLVGFKLTEAEALSSPFKSPVKSPTFAPGKQRIIADNDDEGVTLVGFSQMTDESDRPTFKNFVYDSQLKFADLLERFSKCRANLNGNDGSSQYFNTSSSTSSSPGASPQHCCRHIRPPHSASANGVTQGKANCHLTTSKSVFEFYTATVVHRGKAQERMTHSYEEYFEYSESEDEDEGTETASCSSRDEDSGSLSSCGPSVNLVSALSSANGEDKSVSGVVVGGEWQTHARRVAEELLSSEKSYIKVLHLLDQVFQFRIDQENRVRPMFPSAVVTIIFSNIKSIYKLHTEFVLPQLQHRLNSWAEEPKIGDLVKKFAPFLRMYTEYVKNFDEANATVSTWSSRSPRFAAILAEIQKLPECGHLTLQHHMLAPVQRVPRYELLLKDYLRKLPEDSVDRADTEEALRLVASAADRSNEAAKKIDKFKRLLEVQDWLGGSVDLVSPTRELLSQGKIYKISARSGDHQERHLFVFTDLVLLCSSRRMANRVTAAQAFRIRAQLPVDGLEVVEGDNLVTANTFYIRNINKSIELYTQTADERDEWVRVLLQAIDELKKRKSSLKICEVDGGNGHCASQVPIIGSETVGDDSCALCGASFGTFRKKQSCKACDKVVCGRCYGPKVRWWTEVGGRPHRVCKPCHEHLFCGRPSHSSPTSPVVVQPFISSSRPLLRPSPSSEDNKSLVVSIGGGVLEVCGTDPGVIAGLLYLKIRGKTWTERWFLLKSDFVLYSFACKSDTRAMTSTPIPGYQVTSCQRNDGSVSNRENTFKLFHKKKAYFFQAVSAEELQRWVNALEMASRAEY
ncbi:FYVE, RhoGEF and PH domain-containing protein 6 [Chamberlinius hualienensis]